ncbi:hypothetical protein BGX20_002156, partial [Mortierella sp. AD010]
MSSKKAGLPSLNSINKKDGLQPVKVQRYRAGQAPEGYVDPALESSDEEEDENDVSKGRDGRSKGAGAGGINMSISQEDQQPRVAYKILNIERMTKERQMEKKSQSQSIPDIPVGGASGDRRLARLQAIQMEDRRSRGDVRSRRGRGGSDQDEEKGEEEEEEEEKEEEEDDEEEAALRRRKAARARAMREEAEEEELWGHGEEEEDEEDAGRKDKSRRDGE